MKRIIALVSGLVFAVLVWSTPAPASGPFFIAPPPLGSNSNNCLSAATPCKDIQYVVDNLCDVCTITLAHGLYHQFTDVYYSKVVSIVGDCGTAFSVGVDDQGIGSGTLFYAQDTAILTVQCLYAASYNNSIGFGTRQNAIGDANNINWFNFVVAVAANENSRVNVYSPGLYGGGSRFASMSDVSTISVGGNVVLNSNTFDVSMFSILFFSILNYSPASVSGAIGGYPYQCVGGITKGGVAGLGNGLPYPGSTNCQMY